MSARVVVRPNDQGQDDLARARARWVVWATVAIASGVVVACSYGLLADHPYRGISEATKVSARAQDVLSLAVVPMLLLAATRSARSRRAYLVWLGLLAYLAYSYAIYLIGLPMNRCFLVYVAIETLTGAALIDGVLRIRPAGWARCPSRKLERGTGWFLIVTGSLFATLWLTVLLPFAFGGPAPRPQGVGGAPYPVFVLDLAVALPCVVAVGVLLVRGRILGTPLAVVVLVKIVTLFTALWAGVAVQAVTDAPVQLASDAGPSALLLAISSWLTIRWLREIRAGDDPFVRDTPWT